MMFKKNYWLERYNTKRKMLQDIRDILTKPLRGLFGLPIPSTKDPSKGKTP